MTRRLGHAVHLACVLIVATGCATDLEPPRATTVTVTPGAATLASLGQSAAFTAAVTDQHGNAYAGTVAWTSDAPNVFTVSPAGVATAVSNGTGAIRAQVDGASGMATVTVSQKPTAVERMAGDGQRGRPGTPLVEPVVVRILDAGGSPVAGTAVFFSPAAGSGSVTPGTAPTDMAGEARASWTLGDGFGLQSLVASVADGANTLFTATAQRPNELADSVRVVSGDGQAARPGKGLRSPIVVRVLDEHGAPVEGATVRFETPLGHGLADPDSVRSDHQGEAATTWTLGEKVGLQLLTASVPDGPGVRFTATASVGVCERTPQVRDALVEAAGVALCDEVTDAVLSEIHELYLQSKSIEVLDEDDLAGLLNLYDLDLAQNNLVELPRGLFAGLSNLRRLQLTSNQLVDLPTDVFTELASLERLFLGGNRLAKLPPDVFVGLANLERLDLMNNELRELAPGLLSRMPNLGHLSLAGNRFVELTSEAFSQLTNLHTLYLERNQLAEVSEELSRLINLSHLNLSDNDIADLSFDAFEGLSNLHTLYLDRNQLAELSPGAFEDLSSLRELQLTENRLTDLPVGVFAGLSNLVLHLSGNPLDLRPGAFSGLSDVSLVLQEIQLTDLPKGVFAGVPNLQLNLDGNRLDLRPGVFSGLSNLTGLSLRENDLANLPSGVFAELSNLERLSLIGNQLTVLPAGAFAGLTNLERLELGGNQLTDLPSGVFGRLSNLERLYLGRNQLTHLDANLFGALQELRKLSVWSNQLAALSANQFSGLKKLWMLNLDGNPGSPFPLRLRIERTDTTELAAPGPATMVVRLDEGAPFDMQVALSAPGATLSPATAIIPTGGTRSNDMIVTRDTSTGGSITVRMGEAPGIPEKVCPPEEQHCQIGTYRGIVVIAGDPIVIFR